MKRIQLDIIYVLNKKYHMNIFVDYFTNWMLEAVGLPDRRDTGSGGCYKLQ